ncbi:MAG: hypothetical protein WAW08_17335, partial [Candidatus Microthrix parvicella]
TRHRPTLGRGRLRSDGRLLPLLWLLLNGLLLDGLLLDWLLLNGLLLRPRLLRRQRRSSAGR